MSYFVLQAGDYGRVLRGRWHAHDVPSRFDREFQRAR